MTKEWREDPRDLAYERKQREEDFNSWLQEEISRRDLIIGNIKDRLQDMDPAKLTKIKDWLEVKIANGENREAGKQQRAKWLHVHELVEDELRAREEKKQ